MKGIDISNYQTNVDYARVKNSGIEAAYLKATEGTGYQDRLRDTHYHGLKDQGIKVGFYHFFRANRDAVEQATFFANTVKGYEVDLKHVCDVETTEGLDRDTLSNAVKTFVDKVKELTGIDCIIYTGSSFSKDNLTTVLRGTQLWLAHYTTGTPSWNTAIWDHWSGWQYSDSGNINGIFGGVDVDNFNDDLLVDGCRTYVAPVPSGQVNGANAG
jgi:lysozyme